MFLIILFALPIALIAAHLILRPGPAASPYIVSHRGARALAPENTLMGVREAVAQGAPYTEIDIRRAADGVLVVMHDSSLKRTTGRDAEVEALPSDEIAQLTVHSDTGREDTVPLFDTILEYVASAPVTLVVEVKDPSRYPGIAGQIVESLARTGTAGKVVVGSFDHAWLRAFSAVAPSIAIAPIADWWTRVPHMRSARVVDYDWMRVILDPTFVSRMRAQGRSVWVWTVDSAWLMRLMLWLGVNGITTNCPDVGESILAKLRK